MCIYTMSHQTVNENDFVSERTTQTLKDFTNSKINFFGFYQTVFRRYAILIILTV